MKILFDYQIMSEQKYGGVSRYFIELMKSLNRNDDVSAECKVLLSQNQYLYQYAGKKPVQVKYQVTLYLLELINRIYTYIHLLFHRYDVIHLTWNSPYLFWRKKEKIVLTVHDMIHEIYMTDMKDQLFYNKCSLQKSDKIIAISENTKKDILRFYPEIPEEKITVIYHGTNKLPKAEKPKDVELPKRYLLFVGVRKRYKNAQFLLESAAKILKDNKELSIVFAGGGKFSNEEKSMLKELAIESQVLQLSVGDAELAYLYQNAICFVYPTKYEGFGFPILEAFEQGCPVVCSNTSSLPEVAGDCALYFSPDDGEDLNAQINELLMNEDKRQQLIVMGKERATMFTWDKTAEKTLELYKELLGEKNKYYA